jgi:hypothetical protein
MKLLTATISGLTCAVSGWMLVMYFILRHPGYLARAAIAAVICAGAATLLTGRPPRTLRIPVAVWGIALAGLGAWALAGPGDDGWALIAGALFVAEGVAAISATLLVRQAL